MISSKEEEKNKERNREQAVKFTKTGVDIDETAKSVLGFGSKPVPQQREEKVEKTDKRGGKKGKPQFSADDFPTL